MTGNLKWMTLLLSHAALVSGWKYQGPREEILMLEVVLISR